METRPTSRWPDLWAPTVVVRGTRWPEAAGAGPVRGRPMSSCRARTRTGACATRAASHSAGSGTRLPERTPAACCAGSAWPRGTCVAEGNVRLFPDRTAALAADVGGAG